MLTVGRKLLPDRKELIEQLEETRREYLVEMLVQPGCRLVGKTSRGGGPAAPTGPVLDRDRPRRGHASARSPRRDHSGQRSPGLHREWSARSSTWRKSPGWSRRPTARYEVSPVKQWGRQLCEAVISPSSPLVGQAVRDADFPRLYDAAIVAVHRNGSRLTNKVGDIGLHAGDTLLLQVGPNFRRAYRNNPDFYLVSDVEDSRRSATTGPGSPRYLYCHDHSVC